MTVITKYWNDGSGDAITLTTGVNGIAVSSSQNKTSSDRQMNVVVKTTGHLGTPATKSVLIKQSRQPQPIVLFEANSVYSDINQTANIGPGKITGTANGSTIADNNSIRVTLIGLEALGFTLQTGVSMTGYKYLVFEMEQADAVDTWDYDVRFSYGVANRIGGSLLGGASMEYGKFGGSFFFPLDSYQGVGYYYPSGILRVMNADKSGYVKITKIWLVP